MFYLARNNPSLMPLMTTAETQGKILAAAFASSVESVRKEQAHYASRRSYEMQAGQLEIWKRIDHESTTPLLSQKSEVSLTED